MRAQRLQLLAVLAQRRVRLWIACGLAAIAAVALLRPHAHWLAATSGALARWRQTAVPPQQDRLYGPPLRPRPLDDGACIFDPAAYSRYYPDISNGTDATDDDLVAHYLSHGRAEHRVPQRLRVVGTYEAGAGLAYNIKFGGLCNQMYSHVGMMSVLLQMGAEVVLPDAVHRGGNGFKDSFWSNQVVPIRAPLNTLFDVDHLLAWAASVGVVMHRVRASLKLSDSKRDKVEPPLDGSLKVDVQGPSIGCCNTMEYIVNVIHSAILSAVQEYLAANPDRDETAPLPVVALNLLPPMLMSALRTDTSHMVLVEEVSRNLRPSPTVRAAANAILANLTAVDGAFNGVHLRVEDDAPYKASAGGEQELMDTFVNAMVEANFNASMPLYVASGLLTYMTADEFQGAVASKLIERGLCSGVVVKEQLLDEGVKDGLLSESLALIDLLVLVHARHFTGLLGSSFSWIVQEYRCLQGSPTSTTTMTTVANEMPTHFLSAGALSNHSRTCPEVGSQPPVS